MEWGQYARFGGFGVQDSLGKEGITTSPPNPSQIMVHVQKMVPTSHTLSPKP